MVRAIAILFLAAFLGCATTTDTTKVKMESLTQRYSQFDVKMAWDSRVVGQNTLVEGVVQNVRYLAMYDLEIAIQVLDPAGKTRARGTTFVVPRQLGLDERAEFSVKLPVAVEPGTKLRFTYRYRGSDGGEGFGGGMERGTDWMQSFDAIVPRR